LFDMCHNVDTSVNQQKHRYRPNCTLANVWKLLRGMVMFGRDFLAKRTFCHK